MSSKILYVTDLDGTLLKRKDRISDFTLSAINRLAGAGRENGGIRRYLSLRKGDKRFRPLTDADKLYEGDIFYFTLIGEREELGSIYDRFKDHPSYHCILQQELYRKEYWCEIMPKRATKANAVLQLKELLGCDKITSFGDALNDIPMFEISDACYAVENAAAELKEKATGIIGSNEKDGVAQWLLMHAWHHSGQIKAGPLL